MIWKYLAKKDKFIQKLLGGFEYRYPLVMGCNGGEV